MNKLFKALALAALLLIPWIPSEASEYVFRELVGNTLPQEKCAATAEASTHASDPATIGRFARRFCETQGYGWYVAEQKSPGKLVCETCDGTADQSRCRVEDVVVKCKRLKPGSAGLIPGKS